MKGRKNGCPVNIKNWLVYILDIAEQVFVRIYGLSSLTRSIDSDTEDGSSDTDAWEEPFVTKRKGTISLEGKEVIVESTGETDPGQEILNSYAETTGCDGDATLKFVDPYGHAFVGDFVVTGREQSVDDSESTLSWNLSQVGEVDVLPYVHVNEVNLYDDEEEISELTMIEGDAAKIVTVKFTPEDASNKRFKVSNNRKSVATVTNITEEGFTITPVAVGTAKIAVTTVNGGKVANLTVTVESKNPLDHLTVEAEDSQSTAYDVTVSELQENVKIVGSKISGTLHYKKGYTGFSKTDNDGNFLVLKVDYPEDATTKFTVIGGSTKDKPFPPGDHQLVVKVKDAATQKIKIDIERNGETGTTTYDLSGLTLDPAS